LAAKSRDADAIKRWLRMALEYDRLADSMAAQRQSRAAHHSSSKSRSNKQGRTGQEVAKIRRGQ